MTSVERRKTDGFVDLTQSDDEMKRHVQSVNGHGLNSTPKPTIDSKRRDANHRNPHARPAWKTFKNELATQAGRELLASPTSNIRPSTPQAPFSAPTVQGKKDQHERTTENPIQQPPASDNRPRKSTEKLKKRAPDNQHSSRRSSLLHHSNDGRKLSRMSTASDDASLHSARPENMSKSFDITKAGEAEQERSPLDSPMTKTAVFVNPKAGGSETLPRQLNSTIIPLYNAEAKPLPEKVKSPSPTKPDPVLKSSESPSSAKFKNIATVPQGPALATITEVRGVLKRHIDGFVSDHQCLIKSWLPRARMQLEAETKIPRAGSNDFVNDLKSPFEDMKSSAVEHGPKPPGSTAVEKITNTVHLQGVRNQSSTSTKTVPITSYTTMAVKVPSYTTHASVRHNFLAESVKKLAVWPYLPHLDDDNATEDLNAELKERYSHGNPEDRQQILLNRGMASQLGAYAKRFLEDVGVTVHDVLRYMLSRGGQNLPEEEREHVIQDESQEGLSEKAQLKLKWTLVLSGLSPSTDERQKTAKFACETFEESENFSLWYVVKYIYLSQGADSPTKDTISKPLATYRSLACRVCHVHDCVLHGEITERGNHQLLGDGVTVMQDSSDEDDPARINYKTRVTPYSSVNEGQARSFAYQFVVTPDGRAKEVMPTESLHQDKGVDSGFKSRVNGNIIYQGSFQGDKICSNYCFLNNSNQAKGLTAMSWTHEDRRLLEGLLQVFGSDKRGPCMIAVIMAKPCLEVFMEASQIVSAIKPNERSSVNVDLPKKATVKKRPLIKDGVHQREPCACFVRDRECDEDLCRNCGADEILDPLNKHAPDITVGRCGNVGIQRNVPKRTILGSSEVKGFGLFAGEAVKKYEFIAEYKGEIITSDESDRRGATYSYRPTSYLFKSNKKQDIDATYAGNKTRFINSAHEDTNKNCEPALMLCNTITRVGIYALRDINPGEELFFDYGYPPSAMEHFMEKSLQNGTTVLVKAKFRKPGKKRMRRKADAEQSVLSGTKQLVRSRAGLLPNGEMPTSETSSQRAENEDELEEDEEYEDIEDIPIPIMEEAKSDDDYEDDIASQSSSQSASSRIPKAGPRVTRARRRRSSSSDADARGRKRARQS